LHRGLQHAHAHAHSHAHLHASTSSDSSFADAWCMAAAAGAAHSSTARSIDCRYASLSCCGSCLGKTEALREQKATTTCRAAVASAPVMAWPRSEGSSACSQSVLCDGSSSSAQSPPALTVMLSAVLRLLLAWLPGWLPGCGAAPPALPGALPPAPGVLFLKSQPRMVPSRVMQAAQVPASWPERAAPDWAAWVATCRGEWQGH
jgi:hypothetical protein